MSTTALRYAAALHQSGCPAQAFYDSAAYLTDTPPLWQALCSPAVEVREKKAVLERLPGFSADQRLQRFYALLAEKGRFPWLPEMVQAYRSLERKKNKEGLCVLRCARDPGDQALSALAKRVCAKYGWRALTFEIQVDPEILGVFVLEMDGVTYDKSVRGQLRALAQRLQEGGEH